MALTFPTIKQDNETGDEVVVLEQGNVQVVQNVVSFPNLSTAITKLVEYLRASEDKKLAAARVVQAIDRQQLYREQGFNDMKSFYPVLLQHTAAVGWQAERTVKMWLAFANLYLDQLELPEPQAMKANSHLHAMYVLGEVDRSTGELVDDPEKDGKLPATDFEAAIKVVTGLVTAPSIEQKLSGLDAAETKKVLAGSVTATEYEAFKRLAGAEPTLPQNGWTVADTRELIEKLKGTKKEVKVRQVWYVSFLDDIKAEVESIAWEVELADKTDDNGKPLWQEFDRSTVKKEYPRARFDAMVKGEKVVELDEGNDQDSDGYSDEDE